MRTGLLIGAVFLLIIVLNLITIPVTTEDVGDYSYYFHVGLLPGILPFSIMSFGVLLLILILTYRKMRNPLSGNLKIIRMDFNLKNLYLTIVFWLLMVFLFKSFLGEWFYVFKVSEFYFMVVLLCFYIFFVIARIFILILRPHCISLDKNVLYVRDLLRISRRAVSEIYAIDYDFKNNLVEIKFLEGLDNVSLHPGDYDPKDLAELIRELRNVKNNQIDFSEELMAFLRLGKVAAE